jgi:hypothetical protein
MKKMNEKSGEGALGGIAEMDSFFIRLLKNIFPLLRGRKGFHSMKSELGDPAYKKIPVRLSHLAVKRRRELVFQVKIIFPKDERANGREKAYIRGIKIPAGETPAGIFLFMYQLHFDQPQERQETQPPSCSRSSPHSGQYFSVCLLGFSFPPEARRRSCSPGRPPCP